MGGPETNGLKNDVVNGQTLETDDQQKPGKLIKMIEEARRECGDIHTAVV